MKNKLYYFSGIIFSALMILTGCGKQDSLSKEEALTVGMNANYPPYESYDKGGKIAGFDVDFAQELAAKLGKKSIFKDLTFDALILSLKQGKIDVIISGMSITQSREKEISMIPYQGTEIHELTLAFWKEVPTNSDSLQKILESDNSIISVQVGTFQEEYIKKITSGHVKGLDANSDLILDLQYGKSTVALFEPHIAAAMKKKFPDLQLVPLKLKEEDWVKGNGIGVKKENTHLIEHIEQAIFEMKQEGIISQLETKWFGEGGHVD